MSEKEIPLRGLHRHLSRVVEDAHHGQATIITKHGRPYARIAPLETAMTAEHFTAWLTTDSTCLDQAYADVVVLADELRGEPDDPNAWSSTGDPLFRAATTVDAKEGDHGDAQRQAVDLLTDAGWTLDGTWEPESTGYTATVTRD